MNNWLIKEVQEHISLDIYIYIYYIYIYIYLYIINNLDVYWMLSTSDTLQLREIYNDII
jgi:hypothetical protein